MLQFKPQRTLVRLGLTRNRKIQPSLRTNLIQNAGKVRRTKKKKTDEIWVNDPIVMEE